MNENASQDSLLDLNTLKALDEATANAAELYTGEQHDEKDTPLIPEAPSLLDEDNLEQFFSDEEEQGVNTIDNLNGVMKRVSKKAALMIEGINKC